MKPRRQGATRRAADRATRRCGRARRRRAAPPASSRRRRRPATPATPPVAASAQVRRRRCTAAARAAPSPAPSTCRAAPPPRRPPMRRRPPPLPPPASLTTTPWVPFHRFHWKGSKFRSQFHQPPHCSLIGKHVSMRWKKIQKLKIHYTSDEVEIAIATWHWPS